MNNKKGIKNFFQGALSFLPGVLILFVIFNFNIVASFFVQKTEFKEGTVVSESIKSPQTLYFKSGIKTKEAEDRAAAKVEKVYKKDETALIQQLAKNNQILLKIEEARALQSDNTIAQQAGISLESAAYILSLSQDDWAKYKKDITNITTSLHENDQIRNDVSIDKSLISKYLNSGIANSSKQSIEELIISLIVPNYIYSEEETNTEVDKIKSNIEPVSLLIVKDEVVVSAGRVLLAEDIEKLNALNLNSPDVFSLKNYGQVLIALLLSLMTYVYFRHLYKTKKSVYVSPIKAFYVFVMFSIVSVVAFEMITPLKSIMAYILPIAAPVMLIAILINVETAFFSAIILSLLLGGVFSSSIEIIALYLISSLVGIYRTQFIKKIEHIFSIGFLLSGFSFLVLISFSLYTGIFSTRVIASLAGASLIYGLGSVIIIIGTLLFWGKFFKITTFIELLELENPQQKILRDLSLEAPGTYHHSILVSNLAQKAAKDINADVLISGVGGLYHDIGKLLNPQYYIENQVGENIHDEIKDPEKSAEFIKMHVKEGIVLAKKEGLPKEITHIIESHHGTSEVFYFLKKAEESNKKIDIDNFRYSGPLPKTKEAGIIMLADSVEAKSRAEKPKSENKMKQIIEGIFIHKMEQGQLNNSNLTLDEIETLKSSFLSVLLTMSHKRVKYNEEK